MSRTYEVSMQATFTFTKKIEAEDYDDLNSQLLELEDPWEIDTFDLDNADHVEIEGVYGADDPDGDYEKDAKSGAFEEDQDDLDEGDEEEEETSEEKPVEETK